MQNSNSVKALNPVMTINQNNLKYKYIPTFKQVSAPPHPDRTRAPGQNKYNIIFCQWALNYVSDGMTASDFKEYVGGEHTSCINWHKVY